MRYRDDIAFPMVEYERRLKELRQRMEKAGIDAMMISTPENICYINGFESVGHYYFNCLVVPLIGEPFMTPRLLEDSGVKEYTWIEISRPYKDFEDPMDILAKSLDEFGLLDKRIGFEKGCWFFTALQQERLFAKCPKTNFIDQGGIVEQGRLIKSDYEIAMMRKAARATEAGMRAGIDAVHVGATENDVAADIHYAMIKAGSEWPSISPFVASGPRGAVGHATWAGRTIQNDEFVFIEIAAALKRYHAPMMRTVAVGKVDSMLREGEQIVIEAFNKAVDLIKPGVPAFEVDALTRRIIGSASFGAQQASRAGYSVGIGLPPDWGEGQILSLQPGETRPLQANMTFHLLPWIQIPGRGGVGITGTIRVTETGCEEITHFEKKLFNK
jgi:Xaa-Pro dipeptidase